MIIANILMSFTTMRNRQYQVATPKYVVLALMNLVESVQEPRYGPPFRRAQDEVLPEIPVPLALVRCPGYCLSRQSRVH